MKESMTESMKIMFTLGAIITLSHNYEYIPGN